MVNPLRKKLAAKRQALRLHIEVMNATKSELQRRVRDHQHDHLAFSSAKTAVHRIARKIDEAKQELTFLEDHWHG
jgi:hypothetical protein